MYNSTFDVSDRFEKFSHSYKRRMMLVSVTNKSASSSYYVRFVMASDHLGFLRTAVGFQINKTPTTQTFGLCIVVFLFVFSFFSPLPSFM